MPRLALLVVVLQIALEPSARADETWRNDYPTAARAEYVFACMGANGQTREMLAKCSCSIDLIASRIPYEKYVQAETILRMQQVPGERTAAFRSAPLLTALVAGLRDVQAESTLRCF